MSGYCYRSDGVAIRRDLTDHVWRLYQRWEAESGDPTHGHLTQGLGAYVRQRLDEALGSEIPPTDHEDAKAVVNCLLNYSQFHEGGVLSDVQVGQGSEGFLDIPGGNVKVPAGMSAIIQKLVDGLPEGVIKTNHQVVKIHWADGNTVSIECSNGSVFLCDHVITTMSLGYLKACHHELFHPALPLEKSQAIDRIGFGCVNKIFLYYDVPFWVPGSGSVKLAWLDEEAEPKSADEWYKRLFSFDEVLNNPNVLVGWISGPQAAHMEQLTDEQLIAACTEVIRRFLNNPAIPAAVRVRRSRWNANPWTRGSYSYQSRGALSGDRALLAAPLPLPAAVPRVLFAGEATHLCYLSTMHGARDSGIREAERLIDFFNKAKL